jgi:hypothetical protein
VTFYAAWAVVIAAGIFLAILDLRWIQRPSFGGILLAGLCGGLVTTQVSPFNFADGGYYIEGVLVAAGSALALAGYAVAVVGRLLGRYFVGQRRA